LQQQQALAHCQQCSALLAAAVALQPHLSLDLLARQHWQQQQLLWLQQAAAAVGLPLQRLAALAAAVPARPSLLLRGALAGWLLLPGMQATALSASSLAVKASI
jgi:hypothetical protein